MKKRWTAFFSFFVILTGAVSCLSPESLYRAVIDGERKSAGLSKFNIQSDGHRIVYLEGGKGETVVLLHGYTGNKDNWTRFARSMESRYHLVIPDIPGFGESSKLPEASYDVESQVDRIDRFLEVLKIDRFHLAGNSMGGMIAAVYATKHPGKVASLALFDTGGLQTAKKSEFAARLEKGQNALLVNSEEDFDEVLRLAFVEPPYIPASVKRIMVVDAIASADFNRKILNDMVSRPVALEPYLPMIQAPVLILWGDADRLTDPSGVYVLEKSLQVYRTVVMKDTGHLPMVEKPRESASYYVDFLKDCH
ncbi:MAG: alpha/beta hydrolase [Deltaproteobacteria bacterium]|nr:alpha/beta hydrolase [Deltaproteobacteria bacterium]